MAVIVHTLLLSNKAPSDGIIGLYRRPMRLVWLPSNPVYCNDWEANMSFTMASRFIAMATCVTTTAHLVSISRNCQRREQSRQPIRSQDIVGSKSYQQLLEIILYKHSTISTARLSRESRDMRIIQSRNRAAYLSQYLTTKMHICFIPTKIEISEILMDCKQKYGAQTFCSWYVIVESAVYSLIQQQANDAITYYTICSIILADPGISSNQLQLFMQSIIFRQLCLRQLTGCIEAEIPAQLTSSKTRVHFAVEINCKPIVSLSQLLRPEFELKPNNAQCYLV